MTGIEMVRSGEGHRLYQFDAQEHVQTRLYPTTRASGLLPFNHLAFELLYYWPVSLLPYNAAIVAWALINVCLVFLIGWLLGPYTQTIRQITGIPVVLFLLAFYPVVYVLGEGQDSLLFFLLLVLSLRAIDANHVFVAGFVLALALFKFHLVLLIVFFIVFLPGKWRGLAGFAIGGVLVAGISRAMVGPRLVPDYLAMLRTQNVMTPWGFNPWYMPNLRGFLQWGLGSRLDMGAILPVIFMASTVVGVVATWLVVRSRRRQDASLAYAVAILTTVLISYHLHMQDLAMAALPMMVLTDRMLRRGTDSGAPGMSTPARASSAGAMALTLAVCSLYGFRIAAAVFPALIVRGCLLTPPLLLLWIVSLAAFSEVESPARLPATQ